MTDHCGWAEEVPMSMRERIARAIWPSFDLEHSREDFTQKAVDEFQAQCLAKADAVLTAMREYKFTEAEIERAAEIHGNTPWSAADDSVYTSLFRALIGSIDQARKG